MTLSIPCFALALAKPFGVGLSMINFGMAIEGIPIEKLFDMVPDQRMTQRSLKKMFIMSTNLIKILSWF